jgi:hypothetical protein
MSTHNHTGEPRTEMRPRALRVRTSVRAGRDPLGTPTKELDGKTEDVRNQRA